MTIDLPSIFDVAIGVAFILLLLALVVSAINEVFAKVLSWRSKGLKEGVCNLLADPDARALAGLVYEHPLIRSLGRFKAKTGEVVNPSYIPSNRFAQALTESIRGSLATQGSTAGVTRNGVVLQRGGGVPQLAGADRRVPASGQEGHALPLSTGAVASLLSPDAVADDIRTLIASLPDTEVKKSLLALAKRAEGRLDEFEKSVAEWFDDSMDRVSGWYKRKVQTVMFFIALGLVGLLNANILDTAKALWTQPQLRAAVLAEAVDFDAKQPHPAPADKPGTSTTNATQPPAMPAPKLGTTAKNAAQPPATPAPNPGTSATKATQPPAGATPSRTEEPKSNARNVLAEWKKLDDEVGLPLGWNMAEVGRLLNGDFTNKDWIELLSQIPATIVGWLLTAIAVSLGAPFWFNALNQLLDIRGSGGRRTGPSATMSGGSAGKGGGTGGTTA